MLRTALEPPGRPHAGDGLASTWTEVDGVRMHARLLDVAPPGAPEVVLLHGLGVSSRYLLPLARELGPHFRVHAPDLPGFGYSTGPARALDVPGLAGALLAWLDAAGVARPALVANSMGCQVAVEAARRAPAVFDRLVLIGPTFDPRHRNPIGQIGRWLLTGLSERPGLTAVLARDYLACGPRRLLGTALHARRNRIEDALPDVPVPVLVARGSRDASVPQRWAREVADTVPDGSLAVVPGAAHALNYSAPGPLAAAIGPFLGGPPPGPDAPTVRPAADSIANFDSATAILRGAATALHGTDLPAIGAVPRAVAPLVVRVVPLVNALPRRAREQVYRYGSGGEAVPPEKLHTVSAEAVARWMVDRYPRRRYPAVVLGSSSGALAHLAAALDAPFLPQTFLLPVAQPQVHPDDPRHGLAAARGPARLLLDANPDIALHHMHDPNQDRLSLARMTYFRLKRRRLGPAFAGFLAEVLPRGATVYVADCRLRWPVTRLSDRHVFQFGALGGMPPREFHEGSERVADYLRRYGSALRRWDPPAPDGEAPEAEWGFDDPLRADVEALADRHGWHVRTVPFDDPEELSPLVADLYRRWYRKHGLPADRLLVESFVLLDPWLALTRGAVPYWSKFPVEPSAEAVERYLAGTDPYDEIRLALFSHGTDGVGVAPAERWQALLDRAGRRAAFLGVDPARFPRDFGSFGRFHRALRAWGPRREPPPSLPVAELEEFLADHRR